MLHHSNHTEMQTKSDLIVGGICGMIGGMIKFYDSLIAITYWEALAKAGLTALVCGFLGVAGKHLFTVALKFWKSKIKK